MTKKNQPKKCGITLLLVAATLLSGCASSSIQKENLPAGGSAPVESMALPSEEPLGMQIGLALSGGGSKAAPFALGVMAGLQEADVLDRVGAISSVSGGSYAALYYFTRLVRDGDDRSFDRNQIFWDCIPLQRTGVLSRGEPSSTDFWSVGRPYGYCPNDLSSKNRGVYWQPLPSWQSDPLRYASHLRGHQDVLGDRFDYRATQGGLRETFWDGAKLFFINSMVLGPPNFFANLLYDWRLDLSPSKSTYTNGIVRAWGREPFSPPRLDTDEHPRGSGDPNSATSLTFDLLRTRYQDSQLRCRDAPTNCNFPAWIINTTAGFGNRLNFFDRTKYTGEEHGFEFTPFSYGSAVYGRSAWHTLELEPRMSVTDAVGASAAFFDSQQRTKGGSFFGPMVNLFLRFLNLDWGTDIPNYRLSRQEYDRVRHRRAIWPFPIYMFMSPVGRKDGVGIRLSDGGQSENLGVVALLRRGVKQIIVVDAAEDRKYRLDDLCALHNQLIKSRQPRSVVLFGIEGFPGKCGTARDPFHIQGKWPRPVLKGAICEGTTGCTEAEALAELFILKPVLNTHARHPGGKTLAELNIRDAGGKFEKVEIDQCSSMKHMYPCEVIAFLRSNDINNPFPQHATTNMTANSSPFLYGVYRELGRYYARQLQVKDGRLVVKPSPWLP